MEVLIIIISALTSLAMCLGIYIGKAWGEVSCRDEEREIGYVEGYNDGIKDGEQKNNEVEDFPRTLDGKFFSTDVAIKNISLGKEGDK